MKARNRSPFFAAGELSWGGLESIFIRPLCWRHAPLRRQAQSSVEITTGQPRRGSWIARSTTIQYIFVYNKARTGRADACGRIPSRPGATVPARGLLGYNDGTSDRRRPADQGHPDRLHLPAFRGSEGDHRPDGLINRPHPEPSRCPAGSVLPGKGQRTRRKRNKNFAPFALFAVDPLVADPDPDLRPWTARINDCPRFYFVFCFLFPFGCHGGLRG